MTVWLSNEVAAAMQTFAHRYHPLEAGGVLLGWRDGSDRIVTGLIGPGPHSLHGRHAFVPDHSWQVEQIRKAFGLTGGDLDYLGDWHSHPDWIALMSAIDDTTLVRISRKVVTPLMIIIAGADPRWEYGGWLAHGRAILRRPEILQQEVRTFTPRSDWPTFLCL